MPRTQKKDTPTIVGSTLHYDVDGIARTLEVEGPGWLDWVAKATVFYVEYQVGGFTCRKEKRQRGGEYWFARRRYKKKIHNIYIGRDTDLTLTKLNQISYRLAQEIAAQYGTTPALPITGPIARDVTFENERLLIILADERLIGVPLI